MIVFQKDIKYMLREPATWKLHHNITIKKSYSCDFYSIDKKTRVVTAKKWCGWDGATKFPDFNWILEGSLWHDILHWLIAKGIIPEEENDLIDAELAYIIKTLGGPEARGRVSDLLLKARSKYVQVATGWANEKEGSVVPLYKLEHGKMERIN